jgi:hypothetical protein
LDATGRNAIGLNLTAFNATIEKDPSGKGQFMQGAK